MLAASLAAVVIRFGFNPTIGPEGPISVSYVTVAATIAVAWWVVLGVSRSRDPKIVGSGIEEYRRATRATALTFGAMAIAAVLFKWDLSRGFLAGSFPLGLVGLLVNRRLWRNWLHRRRERGAYLSRVLVIGSNESAQRLASKVNDSPATGLTVHGVWVPDTGHTWLHGDGQEFHPVVDAAHTPLQAVEATRADMVIVTGSDDLGADALQELTWELSSMDVELVISPNLIDVALLRMHLGSVGDEPLLYLDKPQYTQAGNAAKGFFDVSLGTLLLLLATPVLALATLAAQIAEPGGILTSTVRVGRDGRQFNMLRLRLPSGASRRSRAVRALLIRFGVDALPQLLNAIKRDMSLVGPRSPSLDDFAAYDAQQLRRLTVRPGMTGPAQLLPTDELTPERELRLDLGYIANWSVTADLFLLWATLSAVLRAGPDTGLRSRLTVRKPRNLRVAIIGTRGYPSYYGGFETAVRRLAPYLIEQGWDVTVYGRAINIRADDPDVEPRVRSVITRGIDNKSLSTLTYGLTSCIHAAIRRPDVALVMNVANGYWLPLLKARRIPTVVNVDGIEWEREKWGTLAKAVFRNGARATARYGDHLVFDARAIEDRWLLDFGRSGTFIPYGGESMEELPVPDGLTSGGYVLLVARFVPENTIVEFFEAAETLASTGIKVVMVGSTGTVGELDDRARELSEKYELIDWLGHVSDDARLFALWQHAGVYFHGHSVGGTNPALVQAMALGAPTVARDTPFNREVLGPSGVYVRPAANQIAREIRNRLQDNAWRRNSRKTSRERAEGLYTWEYVCGSYEHLLELGSSRSGAVGGKTNTTPENLERARR